MEIINHSNLLNGGVTIKPSVGISSGYRNSFKVLELLINKETSRADIADITGLTRTTVGKIIKDFINQGFVKEKKTVGSGVGRKRILLDIVPSFAHVIGLGISRDKVEGCVTDAKGRLLHSASISLNPMEKSENVLKKILHIIDGFVSEASNKSWRIRAIGVGVPGPLDIEKGIIKRPPKFSSFQNINLVELLKKEYRVDVWVENDADMAAWGEKCYGGGRNLEDFIYIHTCEGIGAGIVINNELYHGKLGYSGEIGHFLVGNNNQDFDYFENLYGTDEIIKRARKFLSKEINCLYDLAKECRLGNEKAISFVKNISKNLGALILSIIHVMGIPDIFIGGKYKIFDTLLLEEIKKIVKKYEFSNREINIRFSQLEDLAMPMGAAAHAIRMYFRKLVSNRK